MAFQKVLVPLDGSTLAERAIPYARAVVARNGGEVVLFTVATITAAEMHPEQPLMPFIKSYLDNAVKGLVAEGIKASAASAQGAVAEQIIEFAERNEIDLIVQSTHGYSGVRRWALGSVAHKVLHGTCIPVLLVKSKAPEISRVELKRILLPLDGSAFSEIPIPYVEKLTERSAAEVVLVRVSQHPFDIPYTGPVDERSWPEHWHKMMKEMEQEALEYLTKTEAGFQNKDIKASLHAPSGRAAERIVEVARDENIDLIVMSTHGRSGVSRWVHGSVASRIAEESLQPVLLVRPCPPERPSV